MIERVVIFYIIKLIVSFYSVATLEEIPKIFIFTIIPTRVVRPIKFTPLNNYSPM